MFQRILVPTDGSEISQHAVAAAIALAKSLGAEIYTICVKEPFPYGAVAEMQPTPPQEFFDAQERNAARHVRAVIDACDAAGVVCHAQTVEGLQPWEAIVEHADEERLRPARDGLARAQRLRLALPRQRDAGRPQAHDHAGARRSLATLRALRGRPGSRTADTSAG